MPAPLPPNESQRLRALLQYDILDTPPESKYDDITALASEICDTPIALITLVEEHRQWFKARTGLEISETPRDMAFCAYALDGTELLIVPDATQDERFAQNPLVTGKPGIRFYAGAPLVTPEGETLGTLCVIDREPRTLSEQQLRALRILSQNVIEKMELRRQLRREKRSTTLLQEAQHIANMGSWELDVKSSALLWSPETCLLFGVEPEEFGGNLEAFLSFILPEDRLSLEETLALGKASLDIIEAEYRILRRDGSIRWMLDRGKAVYDGNWEVICRRGVVMDITERKRAEEAIHQSEKRYRALFERAPVGIATGSFNDIFASTINQRYCDIVGYSREEMMRLNYAQYTHPDDLDADLEQMKLLLAGEIHHYTIQKRFIRKDAVVVWVSLTVVPLWEPGEEPGSCMAVVEDITARRLADETLRQSEERFRNLLQNVPTVAIQGYSLDGTVRYWNKASELFYGYSAEEAVGRNLLDLIVPAEMRPAVLEALRGVREEGRDIPHGELDLLRKDGSGISVFSSHSTVRRVGCEPELFCIDIDLTERKKNEERLVEQATLLDQAHDAILVKDLHDEIIYWNKGAESTYGWTAAEALGRRSADLLSKDPVAFSESFRHLLAAGEWQGEILKRHKDGHDLTINARWTLVRDALGKPKSILAIETDTTERKKFEAHFLRSQRMDSIGTLAGGIAHDLNNMLAPILMSLEILKIRFPDAETASLLDTLANSAQRGADLVRQVLSFARGVEGKRVEVNLVHLMQDIQSVARDTFPKSIQFDFELAEDLWSVDGDPTQLHQVFLNLCVNARDAMPQGGRLVASLANVVLDDTYVAMNPGSHPGSYVLVKISDTGTGMPPSVQEKIFEPFFTTKEFGKGTGLGLSTTQAIVRSHGGFIHLQSEIGRGTTFKIYLPAHSEATPAQTVAVATAPAPLARGNNELILVVDDEEAIRLAVQATLESFGYRVLLASHGAEAISLYASQSQEIAVVLTDMAMPIMDGPATIIALRSLNAAVKIIGSSGLSSTGGVAKATGAQLEYFVAKPYTAEALLRNLHEILHSAE